MENIQTFVFMDLETTGLPSLENNKTKITELSMVAVLKDHLSLGVFKRVQNRLTLSFNPYRLISSESERITGLSNEALENMGRFSAKTVESINLFLDHHPQPVCLVAHNGDRFDYPILQSSIRNTNSSLNESVLCIDSLKMFSELLQDSETRTETIDMPDDSSAQTTELASNPALSKALLIQKINETTPKKRKIGQTEDFANNEANRKRNRPVQCRRKLNFSLKLVDIYKRITKKDPTNAHNADYDNTMTLVCAASLGDKFIKWASENAKRFQEVVPMTPCRKLGQI